MKNLERSVEVEESVKVAKKFFSEYGLNIYLEKKESKNNMLYTYACFCEGIQKQSELISSGKGLGSQAIASALFEAIEHIIYLSDHNKAEGSTFIKEIVDSNERLLEFYPIHYLKKINYSKKIDIMIYENISTIDIKKIQYPSFLVSEENEIDIELRKLQKYRTNSGCASGYSEEEAIIHGINEIVERDSLSNHLKDCFIKESVSNLNIVSPNSLSKNLKEIYFEIQETLEAEIILLDITKYDEFPTYFAYCKKKNCTLPFKGSGTSIFREYAIERTLLEVLQHYHMHDDQDEKEDIITSNLFKQYEKYYNAIKCKYDNFEFNYVPLNYSESFRTLDLKKLLQLTIESLQKYNFDIYVKKIFSSDNLYCIKVLIPGMDNFQIINNGILAVPNNSWENSK